MVYSISKNELRNDLLFETLKALYAALSKMNIPVYVVGAAARDIAMILLKETQSKRLTSDLDVAIAIPDWEEYDKATSLLLANNFKKLKAKQKFAYKGPDGNMDYEVDLVPFGDVAIDEVVKWRPDENPLMSVRCFKDVMGEAIDVNVNSEFSIKIAPLHGQFLIKFDTWLDRHDRTSKDAVDMVFILSKYFTAETTSDSFEGFPDTVLAEIDDPVIYISATWIAYRLSTLLTKEHLKYYIIQISSEVEQKEHSILVGHFSQSIPAPESIEDDNRIEQSIEIWTRILTIFEKEYANR